MEYREPSCTVGGNVKLLQPQWKTVWSFLKNLKIELPYNSEIPLLDICSQKMKTLIWKDICTPMFITAVFIIDKIWKQLKCPLTDERLKKNWYTHTPHTHIYYTHTHTQTMEYYLDIKKNKILPFVTTWMDLEATMLSKLSQTE